MLGIKDDIAKSSNFLVIFKSFSRQCIKVHGKQFHVFA
jgi:hypothetical protein